MSRKAFYGICLDCKAMLHSRDDWEIGSCGIDGRKIDHISNHIPCGQWQRPRWRDFKDPVDEPDKYEWKESAYDTDDMSYPYDLASEDAFDPDAVYYDEDEDYEYGSSDAFGDQGDSYDNYYMEE